jgi:uncharacterized protein (TIGR00369 family)
MPCISCSDTKEENAMPDESSLTNEDTPITLESANQRLSEVFAPWIQDLNLRITSIDSNEVKMLLPYDDRLCRAGDMICGQALMAMIDTCMVFVCYAGLNQYRNCATVNQTTSFLRPAIGTDVVAHGRVIKAGRTLVFGEVTLSPAQDELRTLCTGSLTYAVI